MDRRFIIILAVVVLGLGGIFFVGKIKSNSANSGANTTIGSTSNHTTGGNAKNVSLLVYGDFQCPVCGQFHPIEKKVVDTYKDDILFTFRHFPLDSIHPNARAGSRAAEAAGLQGKFFEMHDLLYENQSTWSQSTNPLSFFTTYATQLGLDVDKFKADFTSETVNNTINADLKEGNQKGVTGTPTYYLNGKKLENGDISSYEKFSAIIEEAIKNASGSN